MSDIVMLAWLIALVAIIGVIALVTIVALRSARPKDVPAVARDAGRTFRSVAKQLPKTDRKERRRKDNGSQAGGQDGTGGTEESK